MMEGSREARLCTATTLRLKFRVEYTAKRELVTIAPSRSVDSLQEFKSFCSFPLLLAGQSRHKRGRWQPCSLPHVAATNPHAGMQLKFYTIITAEDTTNLTLPFRGKLVPPGREKKKKKIMLVNGAVWISKSPSGSKPGVICWYF